MGEDRRRQQMLENRWNLNNDMADPSLISTIQVDATLIGLPLTGTTLANGAITYGILVGIDLTSEDLCGTFICDYSLARDGLTGEGIGNCSVGDGNQKWVILDDAPRPSQSHCSSI